MSALQCPRLLSNYLRLAAVLADDLGYGDCGFTGLSDIHTPNIDAIVNDEHGVRLSSYYGQPVCSPSRTAIHTGRLPLSYGLQTYVIDPAGVDYGVWDLAGLPVRLVSQ